MPGDFTLASAIFDSIEDGLDAVMTAGLSGFVDFIAPLVGAFVSLYFVMMALNWIWSGETSELPVGDLLKRIFYLSLFTFFAFNATKYNTAIVGPVNSLGSEIAEAFASTGSTAPQIIDQMGSQVIDTIKAIWENSPEMSITDLNLIPIMQAILAIVVVGVLGLIFMAISFLYLLIAKILLALALLVGPLYISFAFFPATRDWFTKWLSAIFNYTLLYAMFGITFTLLTNLLQTYVSGNAFSNILVGDLTIIKLIFCYILFTGVIINVPALTAQLTGGVSMDGGSRLIRSAMGAMKGRGGNKSTPGGTSPNQIAGGGNNRKLA